MRNLVRDNNIVDDPPLLPLLPLPAPLAELSRRLLVLVTSTPMPWLGLPFGVLLVMNTFHAGMMPLWGLWSDAGSASTWLLLLLLPQVRACERACERTSVHASACASACASERASVVALLRCCCVVESAQLVCDSA